MENGSSDEVRIVPISWIFTKHTIVVPSSEQFVNLVITDSLLNGALEGVKRAFQSFAGSRYEGEMHYAGMEGASNWMTRVL